MENRRSREKKYRYTVRGIRGVSLEEEKDLQKRKVLSLEWKSEGVMDDESGELMELMKCHSKLGDAKVERLVRG